MLNIIINNPYRILGVYSNSSKKEQVANKGKMQAFIRVGKNMSFPLDLQNILPPIQRKQDNVDKADSCLSLQEEQIKYAQFWFIKKTNLDDIAFNHLVAGKIDEAITIWKKSLSMSSLQNLLICSLIKEKYNEAVTKYAITLYKEHSTEFIEAIIGNNNGTDCNLAHNFIDTLLSENNYPESLSEIEDSEWIQYMDSKRVSPLLSQLEVSLAKAKESKGKGPNARLKAGKTLISETKSTLTELKVILGDNDSRFQMKADKLAQEILQCGIDYFNDSEDLAAPKKALPLCDYAYSIAIGSAAKQRCYDNKTYIEKCVKEIPPEEVFNEAKNINQQFDWYNKSIKKTSIIALQLLKMVRPSLIAIREKLGEDHPFYLEISSSIGNAALSYIIEDVNNTTKEVTRLQNKNIIDDVFKTTIDGSRILNPNYENPRITAAKLLRNTLRSAWETILYIDMLSKTEDFKENRYKNNRKTLHDIINGLNGFGVKNSYDIVRGCCSDISYDNKYYMADSEIFALCRSSSDFHDYLNRFPNGKHADEAKKRIEHSKKTDKIIVIIIMIIAAAVFVFFLALSAKRIESEKRANMQDNDSEISYGMNQDEFISENREEQESNSFLYNTGDDTDEFQDNNSDYSSLEEDQNNDLISDDDNEGNDNSY